MPSCWSRRPLRSAPGRRPGPARAARRQGAARSTIVFTGKGGGRYLDHTRWLHEVTRQCYASRLADETLSVRWRIEWTATLVPGAKGYVLRSPARRQRRDRRLGRRVPPSRTTATRPRRSPAGPGRRRARADLDLHTNGELSAEPDRRTGLRLDLRGPKYQSPGHPCELDIRNDQLVAAVALDPAALARLAAGRALTVPVGHPPPGPGRGVRADAELLALPAPLRRRRVPLRLRRHADLERRRHHSGALAALAAAVLLAGCGGGQSRSERVFHT